MQNSTFLDAYANQQATAEQFATMAQSASVAQNAAAQAEVLGILFGAGGTPAAVTPAASTEGPTPTITIALVLKRAHEPTALLEGSWAERQAALADQATIWSKYGADAQTYQDVQNALTTLFAGTGLSPMNLAADAGYESTVTNRTIWLTLDAAQFQDLFDTPLLTVTPPGDAGFQAWGGNLELPDTIAPAIGGLWVEQGLRILSPAVQGDPPLVDPTPVADDWLGIGNGHLVNSANPAAVAANYNFPLPLGVQTDPIAVIEANLAGGTGGDIGQNLLNAYNQYRQYLGLPSLSSDDFIYNGMASDEFNPNWSASGEFADDISLISGGAPTSALELYGYLTGKDSLSTAFNAYQRAFFDGKAPVLSSSYPVGSQPTAGSPFQWAWQQLFVDGALNNVSTHVSAGDQGSSGNIANGQANVPNSQAAMMALAVGGTSIADLPTAEDDATLRTLLDLAKHGDPTTLFSLVATGLRTLPANLSDAAPDGSTLTALFETVWNRLALTAGTVDGIDVVESDFGANSAGLGGVANGVPIPGYQSDFGLGQLTGGQRGSPDVAALAGGDYRYVVLDPSYQVVPDATLDDLSMPDGGTSAATPLWASLTAQFNAILADQGLTWRLGFYNDLLYTAAVIAPGSFNDILLGNNINSFYTIPAPTPSEATGTPYYNSATDSFMVPTGIGYTAGPGYDLASGLGSPNGLLLARALSAITHAQAHSDAHALIARADALSGTVTTDQTLLVQATPGFGSGSLVQVGGASAILTAGAPLAWTARLAQQSLQSDFDPALVTLFDGAAQATTFSFSVDHGASLAVSLGGSQLPLYQEALSNDHGFVQFGGTDGAITVARPVAIAQTVGGASDQEAILRIRQNGTDKLQLEVYRVDDLDGTIDGVAPGQAGYSDKADARSYHTETGATVISGPGYGQFQQVQIEGVDAGDILAMHLTDVTAGQDYWAFSAANETVAGNAVTHIRNYGLNIWGWEDGFGGGDLDYNDLVVQVDFTSASGHAYIAGGIGGPADDILANGFGPVSSGGSLTGNGGTDLFILRGDVQNLTVADLDVLTTEITDMTVGLSGTAVDMIGLSASSDVYLSTSVGNPLAPYVATAAGGLPVQSIGNAGSVATLATAELIKLMVGVDTGGLHLQDAFDNAIGAAKVTGLMADRAYFFTLYDQTNQNALVGIVQDHNGATTVVEAGDAVSLVGIVPMTSADYAKLGADNFLIVAS